MKNKDLRIFMGMRDVGGYFTRLKVGFDELQVKSEYGELIQHSYEYSILRKTIFLKLLMFASEKRRKTPRSELIIKVIWYSLYYIFKALFFSYASKA